MSIVHVREFRGGGCQRRLQFFQLFGERQSVGDTTAVKALDLLGVIDLLVTQILNRGVSGVVDQGGGNILVGLVDDIIFGK